MVLYVLAESYDAAGRRAEALSEAQRAAALAADAGDESVATLTAALLRRLGPTSEPAAGRDVSN